MTREGYRWQSRLWRPSEVQARILDGIARGLTNAEIASEIGMSRDGVKWHVSRALAETGLSERQSLARWWQGGPLRMSRAAGNEQRATSNEFGRHVIDLLPSMRRMQASFGVGDTRDFSWRILAPPLTLRPSAFLADKPTSRIAE